MNTPSLPIKSFNNSEPIPGYLIKERIGAGGYGEVWKAEAPGGIAKAIKIVYGYLDDERAARELKSLNRIKEVRHPFLLSLDRIEVVDNHLLIVSELATSSLKDRFEECRAAGLDGIPREELMMHLRDVADALDYICNSYSLQHLDIKPENLLLVGGRVKVADFGLVKELHDVQSSFMGGLTPVYAPPEVFDGRPDQHSDQYSLAIVYQEMLTGTLPFQGRTTAQLAAQHLHSRPNLSALPVGDQAAVARALSKDPQHRFTECRSMMKSLRSPRMLTPLREMPPAGGPVSVPSRPVQKTEVLFADGLAAGEGLRKTVVSEHEPTTETSELPPLDLGTDEIAYRPVLFIGIGGLAGRALQGLRRRLVDRFGELAAVPAVQMMLLDTDGEAIRAVTSGEPRSALDNESAMLLPLRQTADYRRDSDKHLQWMSRRWLYNIPRSQQTKGFRPLGRLALVDQAERVYDRLRKVFAEALDEEKLAASSEKSGLKFMRQAPRVVVLASITGGTGSGMVVDVGYAVQKILAEMGIEDDALCGILAHCTDRRQQSRDVALANAYACLSELHHYTRPGMQYPGDSSCGLPAFHPGQAAFRDTYLVHLGDDLDDGEYAEAAETLAEYLYRSTVTPASAFFDTCRDLEHADPELASAGFMLRSFALSQLACSYSDLPSVAAEELCRGVLERWRGVGDNQPARLSQTDALIGHQLAVGENEASTQQAVTACVRAQQLDVRALLGEIKQLAEQEMGSDADSFLRRFFEDLTHNYESSRGGDSHLTGPAILETVDALVGNGASHNPALQVVSLESALTPQIEKLAAEKAAVLRQWVLEQIVASPSRVKGAQTASEGLVEYLQLLNKQTDELLRGPRMKLAAMEKQFSGHEHRVQLRTRGFLGKRKLVIDSRLSEYFRLRVEEAACCGLFRLLGQLHSEISMLRNQIRDLWRDLNRMTNEWPASPEPTAGNGSTEPDTAAAVRKQILDALHVHKAELIGELDRQFRGELKRAISENLEVRKTLVAPLRSAARNAVLQTLKQVNVAHLAMQNETEKQQPIRSLFTTLANASSRLRRCGGGRRLLLVLPESLGESELQDRIKSNLESLPTVTRDSDNDLVLCYETEQLPLHRVANALIDYRPDYMQLASRLHTRIDVNWTPL